MGREFGIEIYLVKLIILLSKYVLVFLILKIFQCGFKLFTRKAAIDIFNNLHIVKWAFDGDILYICIKFGIRIKKIIMN